MIRDRSTQDALLGQLGRFVAERLIPAEERAAAEDRVPPEIVQEMRDLGLFGLSIPEDYGGLGLTMEEEVEAALVIGRAAPAFRSVFGTNNGIGSQAILLDGTEEQKRRWVPDLASGAVIASFALTEPDVGSDAASVKTRAVQEGPDWIITGTKRFITNGPSAGLFTVMARSDAARPGADGVTAFIVEGDRPGLSRGKPEKKMGQQGAHVCDIHFDGVRVPAENVIGLKPGRGFRTAMKVLDRGRLHISAVCCGLAERLIDDALAYALQRKQFGKPIAEHQLVQALLADSKAEALAARALVLEGARQRDAGQNVTLMASAAKLFCAEMLGRVADRAVQVHGGAGYIAGAVERLYRDARLFRLYEGTTQIQQIILAREMAKAAT